VELFKAAISTYGTLNIVVANAGVAEGVAPDISKINLVQNEKDGKLEPSKPSTKVLEINLLGVMYSTRTTFVSGCLTDERQRHISLSIT
jgi:hypothetical protein